MGIKGFFYGLLSRTDSSKFINSNIAPDTKYLLLDYNSIVHNTSAKIQDKLISLYLCKLIFDKLGRFDIRVIDLIDNYLLKYFDVEETKESIDTFFSNIEEEEKAKEYLDSVVIKHSCDYIKYLKRMYPSCEEVYVAIDGVPYKAKMVEQKKRRFIGELMQRLTKKFIDNARNYNYYYDLFYSEEEMYFDLRQFELDCMKFKFSKGKITPGTRFMDELQRQIREIDGVVLDGYENPGEGERKIVEKMNMYMTKRDYNSDIKITVYSPDADVIILMCLENTKFDIKIHRYESDTEFKIIHIRNFCEFLIKTFFYDGEYLSRELEGLDQELILKDILMLFSLLGNDFIPDVLLSSPRAMFKINPSKDLNIIINEYYEGLARNKRYLLNYNADGHYESINWVFCDEILKSINEALSKTKKFRPSRHTDPIVPVKRRFPKEEESKYRGLTDYLNTTYPDFNFIDISDEEYNPLLYFTEDLEKVGEYNPDHLKSEYAKLLKENRITEAEISEKYVVGIDWVCKYYLNYDNTHNEWFYDTIFPPTLFNLSNYIKTNIGTLNRTINEKLEMYRTKPQMTPYHHLQYVSYKDIEPLIDETRLTSRDRENIAQSKKNVDWDKIYSNGLSQTLICHFSKFLSQCHIKDEEQYERRLDMGVAAATGAPIAAPVAPTLVDRRLPLPLVELPAPVTTPTTQLLSSRAREFVPRTTQEEQKPKLSSTAPEFVPGRPYPPPTLNGGKIPLPIIEFKNDPLSKLKHYIKNNMNF